MGDHIIGTKNQDSMAGLQVIALVSGGKDSVYSAMKCEALGHSVVVLANLFPTKVEEQRDSYMYQTQGWEMLPVIASCMGLPLEARPIKGKSLNQALRYEPTSDEDEVEDLFALLRDVKAKYPSVNAVCSGAVLSNYQRTRIENCCERLGLTSLAMLWNRDQKELLTEMIDNEMNAVLVKVCSMGLDQKHLGRSISELKSHFFKLDKEFGFHVCGEGGEYETITLDCPVFRKGRIVLDEVRAVTLEDRAFSPICVLDIVRYHVEAKEFQGSLKKMVQYSPQPVSRPHPATDLVSSPACRVTKQMIKGSQPCSWVLGPIFGSTFEEAMNGLKSACGGRLEIICYVHLYLRDLGRFGEANTALPTKTPPPARATVELEGLDEDCQMILTAMIAPDADSRKVLQVRSRSEWAPQCIGPYSQCNVLKNQVGLIAGQIPLHPSTMLLCADLSTRIQLKLAMRHCIRIALDSTVNAKSGLGAIVYVNTFRGGLTARAGIQSMANCLKTIVTEDEDQDEVANDDPVGRLDEFGIFKKAEIVFLSVPRLPRDAEVEVELVCATADGIEAGVRVDITQETHDADRLAGSDFTRLFIVDAQISSTANPYSVALPVQAIGVWHSKSCDVQFVSSLQYSIRV